MKYTALAPLALTIVLTGCNNLHGRPAIERKARSVAPDRPAATETIDPDIVVSPGVVEPWDAQVELSAQESGWIAQLFVKEGDVVQVGRHELAYFREAPPRADDADVDEEEDAEIEE